MELLLVYLNTHHRLALRSSYCYGGERVVESRLCRNCCHGKGQGSGLDPGRLVCKPLATESPVSISVT